MLSLGDESGPKAKCHFTHTSLPGYVDLSQPPTRKQPFSTVLNQPFNHTLTLIVPTSVSQRLDDALKKHEVVAPHYAKVHMKLIDLLSGDFFDTYIKAGNVLMLSEGRPGIDHVYSLKEGMIRMEIDRPTYERTGLQGQAIANQGRKHVKARFAIEINLRLPSMVPGKPAFDRLLWACRSVLNRSVTWLFVDLKKSADETGPMAAHQPIHRKVEPDLHQISDVLVPSFPRSAEQEDYIEITELLEWLSLVMNGSPTVQMDETVDPYLCRYRVPGVSGSEGDEPETTEDLTTMRWHGFITAAYISKVLQLVLNEAKETWFALAASSFTGNSYNILKTEGHALMWEYED